MTEPPGAADAAPARDQIRRRSLADESADRLRDLIVAGEFSPGQRLPERELCERFDVSRTPLREAMKILASEGLVRLLPNRGAIVPPLTQAELIEVFEVLEALESQAGELAAARMSDAAIADVRTLHEAMVRDFEAGDLQAYFRRNQEIHWAIVAGAANRTLADTYRRLSGRILRARYAANLSGARWAQAIQEHEMILAALEARDGVRLGGLLRTHLANKLAVAQRSGALAAGDGSS